MGIGMPKFVSDGCESVKGTYYSIKNGYQGLKEVFVLARTAWKMAKSLDTNQFEKTGDPKDIINSINTPGADIPEAYKSLLKVIPEDTLKKLTSVLYESLMKTKPFRSDNEEADPSSPHHEDQQRLADQRDFPTPDFTSRQGVSEAIGRMVDSMTRIRNKPAHDFASQPPQQEYVTPEPPENNYHPEYSEMKSDDERDYKLNSPVQENEVKGRGTVGEPFAEHDHNYNNTNPKNQEQPFFDSGDTTTFSPESPSTENSTFDSEASTHPSPFEAADSFQPQEENYFKPQEQSQEDDFSFQNATAQPFEKPEKKLAPVTKMLGEELQKRYGPRWREKIPGFLHTPEIAQDIPDLGLGLGKEGNRDMVVTISKVIKDLL